MLNFKALDNVYNKFQQDLITEAQKCSDDIKTITKKFEEYNLGCGINHVWQEDGGDEYNHMEIDCGMYWDAITKKIMFWVDTPSEGTILAGESARTRASVRPKLQNLINSAVTSVNRERDVYLPHVSKFTQQETPLADVMNMPVGEYSETEEESVNIQEELEAMIDEEYDEHIYREPVNGGQSIADEMLTNGNR